MLSGSQYNVLEHAFFLPFTGRCNRTCTLQLSSIFTPLSLLAAVEEVLVGPTGGLRGKDRRSVFPATGRPTTGRGRGAAS